MKMEELRALLSALSDDDDDDDEPGNVSSDVLATVRRMESNLTAMAGNAHDRLVHLQEEVERLTRLVERLSPPSPVLKELVKRGGLKRTVDND